jgi:SAM-dependent methyltransferase
MEPHYTVDFFEKHREGARKSARAIVPMVMEWVRPRSVVDVGCGTGTWLSSFREFGVEEIFGVDGPDALQSRLEIAPSQFLAFDLGTPLRIARQFDLVVSLEVAEHLPAECAGLFVESLTRLGPVVLFSAAIPFQGGTHHVNEQWPAYWAKHFGGHGYVPFDCLRRRIWQNEAVEWWYAQNILLFGKEERIAEYPALMRERETSSATPMSLVHPKRYLEWVEWGMQRYES